MNTYITIIIPCYNELENLKRGVLQEVEDYLKAQSFSWEVIISDDASTDGSYEFVKGYIKGKKSFSLLKNTKGGKAFAVKSAVEKANGMHVLFTDMDQSTPLKEFSKLKPYLDKNFEVVIGSRGFKRENFPLLRKIASPLFLLFRRCLILPQIRDTQCGFKSFNTQSVIKIFDKLSVFKRERGSGWRVGAWDVEMLYVASKMRMTIKEITVDWSDTDTSTSKERKFLHESVEMLKEVLRVRYRDILGEYDK
jgi:glycosyltransferase involved in cell wall biosynthesis